MQFLNVSFNSFNVSFNWIKKDLNISDDMGMSKLSGKLILEVN